MATHTLRGSAAYLNRDGLTAMTDAEWASKNDTSPSIGEAYRRGVAARGRQWPTVSEEALKDVKRKDHGNAHVFGERRTMPLWDGTMSTKLVQRERDAMKRGTCADKV